MVCVKNRRKAMTAKLKEFFESEDGQKVLHGIVENILSKDFNIKGSFTVKGEDLLIAINRRKK